jgi:hypothetical protein
MSLTDAPLHAWLNDSVVFDPWTPLAFKGVLANRNTRGITWMAPVWCGEHTRRIQGYITLMSYVDNSSRILLKVLNQEDLAARDNRREYGDAKLLVDTIRAALIGDEQSIVVEGADKFDPANPIAEALQAKDREDFLQNWAEEERFLTKLIETERNAVAMGDGVYSLGWDPARGRVRLRTWDPSAYFPVITEYQNEGDYPERVHLAWQLPDEGTSKAEVRVRRITYELVTTDEYAVPWSEEPANKTCLLTDAVYTIDRDSRSPDDLTDNKAVITEDAEGEIKERDLGIDFLPVVHIPNTVAVAEHFGRSVLSPGLQILDDIQATDSDLQLASALTGAPMVVLSGKGGPALKEINVRPGKGINVGENGRADVISGADGLGALAQYRDDLRKIFAENSRVPASALGRVDQKEFSSGIQLGLSFGPLKSMIDEMRLVRRDKYALLFKFVQRFHMKNGDIDGPELPANVVFGSFLPSDRTAVVDDAMKMIDKAASRETVMKMLQEVGIPIEDVAAESDRIDRRDFDAAVKLLDATGNTQAVEEFLRITVKGPENPETANNPAPVPSGANQNAK